MAVYKKWMSAAPAVSLGAVWRGGDLAAAAEIIADRARGLASAWSVQIPPAVDVEVAGNVATVSCSVGPAYPNEIEGVRHPVFARGPDRADWEWVTNEHRPFLGPAADLGADAAMDRYADKLGAMLWKAGFR
jgi:hypothetical protein